MGKSMRKEVLEKRVKQCKTLVHFSAVRQKHNFRSKFGNVNLLTFNSHFESIKQCEIHIPGKYATLRQHQLGKLETERMWQGIVY